MAYSNTFKRGEKKFLLNPTQYKRVREALAGKMAVDQYGRHTILNVYCDNEYNESVIKSLSKPVYKEKLRLRSYGIPTDDSTVFLEIKKKFKGVVYKRRIEVKYRDAWNYLCYNLPLPDDSQQEKEIDYLKTRMRLKPYVFVGYNRIAMYGLEDNELRVTFDTNIRYRYDDLDLKQGDSGKIILGDGNYLMEVKCAGSLPIWFADILAGEKIYSTSFSKVGNVFTKTHEGNKNLCLQIS
ncbi:MAG: polyphosphate polymerase domain-containing protein [Ruminococcus sp.]|nr:polyphosphate polymerase domain-containing protein [Ruminococcus sp.]